MDKNLIPEDSLVIVENIEPGVVGIGTFIAEGDVAVSEEQKLININNLVTFPIGKSGKDSKVDFDEEMSSFSMSTAELIVVTPQQFSAYIREKECNKAVLLALAGVFVQFDEYKELVPVIEERLSEFKADTKEFSAEKKG